VRSTSYPAAPLSLLVCSTPVHGHVTPLLAVARTLVASGHTVRFLTGTRYRAAVEETEYRALNPDGKAVLKAAEYLPPHEEPSPEYPMQLITGRTIYHFHTRTKTARAPELNAAAPEVWVELNGDDAQRLGLAEGEPADVVSPRGRIRAAVRIAGIRPGVAFVPFHYGYWDTDSPAGPEGDEPGRAANEMTITDWDPVSKQPLFKLAAVRIEGAS